MPVQSRKIMQQNSVKVINYNRYEKWRANIEIACKTFACLVLQLFSIEKAKNYVEILLPCVWVAKQPRMTDIQGKLF